MNLFEELQWRGLVHDSIAGVEKLLNEDQVTFYIGFDPTADALHIGSLVPMMTMARLQKAGHKPIALVGGGTGMIGDPSGKSAERNLLDDETLAHNVEGLKRDLAKVLDFDGDNAAIMENNATWLTAVGMIEFLRDVGKHFSVNAMLAKDSVKGRIEREGEGISFTEFSYMLLQSWDFQVLFEKYGCTLQMGGSDQWGNITGGVDLIRRVHAKKVYGLVFPLVTKADGTKFGKTAGGSVWLEASRTSPYKFYQFWLNQDDADVIRYLKLYTWLSPDEIEEIEATHAEAPHRRFAQKRLAEEITTMIHGEEELAKAQRASQVLFGGSIEGLGEQEILDIFADVPSSQVEIGDDGDVSVVDLFADSGLASGKGDARRKIKGGGMYVNNARVEDDSMRVGKGDGINGRFIILRQGKKKYHLVELT